MSPLPPDAGTPPLTDEQTLAVERRRGSLQLSASAGSGKTAVLVERFVAAVVVDGVAPGAVLAITFTDRAAGELRARVRARLLAVGERELARDCEAAFVGTFHSFCARLLRANPLDAGVDPGFAILEEGQSRRLRDSALDATLRGATEAGREELLELLARYRVDRVRTMILDAHACLRSRGQRLPRLPLAPPAGAEDRPAPGVGAGDPVAAPAAAGAAPVVGGAGPCAASADVAETAALEHRRRDAAATAACAELDAVLRDFGLAYEQLKRARAALDFDDLEILAGELLAEHRGVRDAWAGRFELLMVDEFQDTNHRQLRILRALDRGNLFAVGDEHQSIYGFRHADVRLFRQRRDELAATGASLALRRNFRSSERVLDVVNAVFAERLPGYEPLLAGRPAGAAEAGAGNAVGRAEAGAGAPPVELLLTGSDGWEEDPAIERAVAAGLPPGKAWRQAEARLLAQRVGELVRDGLAAPGEIVVLLRATGDIEVFERALQLAGMRTLAAVGDFWGHQQIGDLTAYLRALANPLDELALFSVLASPLGGCSRDGLALLADLAREHGGGVWQAALTASAAGHELLAPDDRARVSALCTLLDGERRTASSRSISELIERAMRATGYREHVLSLDWGERRLANVHKLLRVARRFEAAEGRDLRGLLDHVEYLREAAVSEPDAPVEGVEPDAVRLMTIHAAKGLEFPVVCLADLGRSANTQSPDLLLEGERLGLRLPRSDGEGSEPALEFAELYQERRAREAEEEERILYVAMTRARERLLLSGSLDLARWPAGRLAPISWLGPALCADIAERVRDGSVRTLPLGDGVVGCMVNTPATVGAVLRLECEEPDRGEGSTGGVGARPPVPRPATPSEPPPGPGELPARVPAALSYTALSALERCGYRYYLERALSLPEVREPAGARGAGASGSDRLQLQARERGVLVHALMEKVRFHNPRPADAAQARATAQALGLDVSVAEAAEVAELVSGACASGLAARAAAASAVRREHPFAFALAPGQPLVSGVIDLIAIEPDGGYLVLDYKSDRVEASSDLGAAVARDYELQRVVYALAALRDGAESVEVVHWYLERPDESVAARFTAADRARLEGRLATAVGQATAGPFAVSPRPHRALCLGCPGRSGLCSWSEADTLREVPQRPGGRERKPPGAPGGQAARAR